MKMGPNDGPSIVWALGAFNFWIFLSHFYTNVNFFYLGSADKTRIRMRLAQMKMGPNDAGCIIWVLGGMFSFFLSLFLILMFKC